jgi:hypothetical protein
MAQLRTLTDDELIRLVEASCDPLTTTALELELTARLREANDSKIAFLDSLQERIDTLHGSLETLIYEIETMKEQ